MCCDPFKLTSWRPVVREDTPASESFGARGVVGTRSRAK